MIKYLSATENPAEIGKIVALSTTVPCVFAAFCFYRAGIHYAAQKAESVAVVEKAMEKVSVY